MLCDQCLLPVVLDKIEFFSVQFPTDGRSEGAADSALLGWAVCAAQAWQGQSISAPGLIETAPVTGFFVKIQLLL